MSSMAIETVWPRAHGRWRLFAATFLVSVLVCYFPVHAESWWRAKSSRSLLQFSTDVVPAASNAAVPGNVLVTSAAGFIAALFNPGVTVINVNRSIVFNDNQVTDQIIQMSSGNGSIQVNRNVTVVGLGVDAFYLLDFGRSTQIIALPKNTTLEFRSLRVRGVYYKYKLDEFPAILTPSSSGLLRFSRVYLHRTACQMLESNAGGARPGIPGFGAGAKGGAGDKITPDQLAPVYGGSNRQGIASEDLDSSIYSAAPPDDYPGDGSGGRWGLQTEEYDFGNEECLPILGWDDSSALAVDGCYEQPLKLIDTTYTISGIGVAVADDKKAGDAEASFPVQISGGIIGAPIMSGGKVPGNDNLMGDKDLLVSFNNTILLCDVFVNRTCEALPADQLEDCIQELLDRKYGRPPPPPPPPQSSAPPLPPPSPPPPSPSSLPPPLLPSPSSSPLPPLPLPPSNVYGDRSPDGATVVPLAAALVPAIVGSFLLAVVILGGIVWWRRRQARRTATAVAAAAAAKGGESLQSHDSDQPPPSDGSGGWWRRLWGGSSCEVMVAASAGGGGSGSAAGGKLQGQDSDPSTALQSPGGGGAAAGKGGSSGAGKAPAASLSPSSPFLYPRDRRYRRDTPTSVSASTSTAAGTLSCSDAGPALSSALTGLTTSTAMPASPGDSGGDPTRAIQLHHILGVGSFGRVYYGTWQGQGVAVKIIPHSEAANSKVQQEVALVARFNHPNVVRALHCVTFDAAALEHQHMAQLESLRTSSTASATPALNMETWIMLEYCDAGPLAAHLAGRSTAICEALGAPGGAAAGAAMAAALCGQESGDSAGAPGAGAAGGGGGGGLGAGGGSGMLATPMGSLLQAGQTGSTTGPRQQVKDAVLAHLRGVLSVARDIATGMAYLHSLNVCHGDLKCENVLLCWKPAEAGGGGSGGGAAAAAAGSPVGSEASPSGQASASPALPAAATTTTAAGAGGGRSEGSGRGGGGAGGDGPSGVRSAATMSETASSPNETASPAAPPLPSTLPPAAASASATSAPGCSSPSVHFVAKVADFGLSKAFNEASTHMSTATVGTVTHMCPVLLQTGQMRPSCDVFSFGIILWQLTTGGTPFAGMRYAEIVYKVAVAGLRPEFPPHVPRRLVAVAEACWAADPNIRPTFDQLVVQLGELGEAADELQAEQEAAIAAAREGAVRVQEVTLAAYSSEDVVVANQWAAAAAAALLE